MVCHHKNVFARRWQSHGSRLTRLTDFGQLFWLGPQETPSRVTQLSWCLTAIRSWVWNLVGESIWSFQVLPIFVLGVRFPPTQKDMHPMYRYSACCNPTSAFDPGYWHYNWSWSLTGSIGWVKSRVQISQRGHSGDNQIKGPLGWVPVWYSPAELRFEVCPPDGCNLWKTFPEVQITKWSI